MSTETSAFPRESLTLVEHGLFPIRIHANLTPPALIEHALRRSEGQLTDHGAFAAVTSPHTGRSAKDKFLIEEPGAADRIWREKNPRLDPEAFERLHEDVRAYLDARELYVQDLFGGADPAYRVPVRFVTPNAWHALFVRNMFIRAVPAELAHFRPGFTVLHAPDFQADPARHGTRSGTFIVIHFGKKLVLIGGTRYAGEMKKSIFTALNYVLPAQGVMTMHCSANIGPEGDTAVFFGLSGTGKTTLSADPDRRLIGDDEHGWSDRGVFNFEGGCYAKVIRLRPDTEPEIYAATQMFGTVLENVVLDPATRAVDFDADKITENTRACYPIHYIPNFQPSGSGGHPKNVVFLTADAFGVMPPIARLTADQAMYHFLSGLHRQGGWHRARGHRAHRHLLRLLRRAVPAAAPRRVRPDAGRADREARGQRLAGEHRLDRRAVRHGLADEARRTPGPWCGRRWPARSTACPRARIRCSASRCPTAVPEVPAERPRSARAPGRTLRPTMPRPASWRGCSGRTSSSTGRRCRTPWPRQARWSKRAPRVVPGLPSAAKGACPWACPLRFAPGDS